MKTPTKKFKKFLLFLAFGAFVFIACEDKPTSSHGEVKPPKEIISVEQAKTLFEAYSDRRVPIIQAYEAQQDTTSFNATRFGWYDYATLKQYMAYIEQEADKAGVEISGISIYLGNYPNQPNFKDGKPIKYPRQNTNFFVPTMKYDGQDMGFLVRTSEGGRKTTAIMIRDIVSKMPDTSPNGSAYVNNKIENKLAGFFMFNLIAQDGGDKSLILNEAGLTPPPPKPTDFGK